MTNLLSHLSLSYPWPFGQLVNPSSFPKPRLTTSLPWHILIFQLQWITFLLNFHCALPNFWLLCCYLLCMVNTSIELELPLVPRCCGSDSCSRFTFEFTTALICQLPTMFCLLLRSCAGMLCFLYYILLSLKAKIKLCSFLNHRHPRELSKLLLVAPWKAFSFSVNNHIVST